MNREERAKQFHPFDALKGLREELKLREMRVLQEEKRLLAEEEAVCLSRRLAALRGGELVEFSVYDRGHYRQGEGRVVGLDRNEGYLRLENERILLTELYRIRVKKTSD